MNSRKFAEFLGIAHEFDGTCLCAGVQQAKLESSGRGSAW
jgi:hypothetical protein